MQRKVPLPDGRTATYEDVPITVTEEMLRRQAAQDYPEAFKGADPTEWIKKGTTGVVEDVGRSAWGGTVKGAIEGVHSLFRKIPSGLAMMGLDALGQEKALDKFVRASGWMDENLEEAPVNALGGNYKAQTTPGRYVQSAAQGVGGSIATGGVSPWQMALGAGTGLAMQGASDAKLGDGVQMAIAFGLPVGAALTRRTLFPKLGYDEVQAAMGVPPRHWYSMGRDKPLKAAVDQVKQGRQVLREGQQQGVDLTIAQGIQQPNAPQSGIINLQNRVTPTTAGATTLQPMLVRQAEQANRLVDDIITMAKESGRYETDLAQAEAMYKLLRSQQLTPNQLQAVVDGLRGSSFYDLKGGKTQRFLEKFVNLLENQGKAQVPAQTVNATTTGPGGLPLVNTQTIPAHTVPTPAKTQGQLLDARGEAGEYYPEEAGIRQAVRAEARTMLNKGRSPQVEAIDKQFGEAIDKKNFVKYLEEEAKTARSGAPEYAGSKFAHQVRGAPGSKEHQEWVDAVSPVKFESPDTAERMAQALALLERTGYGRGGTRAIDPREYGQARASAAAMGTTAAGLSGARRLLAITPGIKETFMEAESTKIAEALADPTGKKLTKLIKYNPNDEMTRNILLSLGIGYGLENPPTGE